MSMVNLWWPMLPNIHIICLNYLSIDCNSRYYENKGENIYKFNIGEKHTVQYMNYFIVSNLIHFMLSYFSGVSHSITTILNIANIIVPLLYWHVASYENRYLLPWWCVIVIWYYIYIYLKLFYPLKQTQITISHHKWSIMKHQPIMIP